MKIGDVENFVKTRTRDQIKASPKIQEKIEDRGLTIDFIKDTILENDIVGIMDQGSDVYLFSFKYSYWKDLVIVIRIKGKMAYIVTAFPQDAEKRVKHEKTKKEKGKI